MKYNFNVPILDLDDKPMKEGQEGPELVLSKVLARQIHNATDFEDTMKLMETWARPLFRGEEIEMDDSDKKLFTGILKNPRLGIPQFVREAALIVIRQTELESEKKKAEKNGKTEHLKAS
jgi:hypothetical protein